MRGLFTTPPNHPFNVAFLRKSGSAIGGDGVYPSQCTFSLAGKRKVLPITVYPIPFFALFAERDLSHLFAARTAM